MTCTWWLWCFIRQYDLIDFVPAAWVTTVCCIGHADAYVLLAISGGTQPTGCQVPIRLLT
jgi:hypothetical protein